MSAHLTNNQIEDYGRRMLPAAQLLSVSDHLEGCETCRLKIEKAMDGDAAVFALKSGVFGEAAETPVGWSHLTFEQTADYVDEALASGELRMVKDHLSGCEQCVTEVDDLRAFKNQLTIDLDREYQPSPVQGAAENRWRRFVAALSYFSPKSPRLVFGSALAALLLIAAGWLIWQASRERGAKPDITVTPPSPTVSPTATPEGAAATVAAHLNDGPGQIILDRDGKLSGVDNLPPAYRQMIKGALSDQRLEKSPLLAELARPEPSTLRSSDQQGNEFSVISPIGKVMRSDRPTFRWSRLVGATGYLVEVYDEQFKLVASSPRLSGASWTPPKALKRGGIYAWQVKAFKGDEEFVSPHSPAPQAPFRILDEAQANELARARRAFASSHLTMGLLYARAGLLDEAEREFHALEKANPDSEISRRLLANLQAMRR